MNFGGKLPLHTLTILPISVSRPILKEHLQKWPLFGNCGPKTPKPHSIGDIHIPSTCVIQVDDRVNGRNVQKSFVIWSCTGPLILCPELCPTSQIQSKDSLPNFSKKNKLFVDLIHEHESSRWPHFTSAFSTTTKTGLSFWSSHLPALFVAAHPKWILEISHILEVPFNNTVKTRI